MACKYKYKASVIIPTYNRSALLKQTLNTLLKQDISKEKFEVIVIDDGSTDNTEYVVNEYKNKLNIKYYKQEHNGFRVASIRNIGIKKSEGDICIFVDSGVLIKSNGISSNIKTHKCNENIAVIGYMYGFDEYNENEEIINKMHIDSLNVDGYIEELEKKEIYDLREKLYSKLGDDIDKWPAPWAIFWTGYASVKRDLLISVGMFDENFNSWGGEDVDLALNLYIHHVKFVLNRELKSIHLPHEKFKASIDSEELKKRTVKKRQYIHDKYKLKTTELYINMSSFELNEKFFGR